MDFDLILIFIFGGIVTDSQNVRLLRRILHDLLINNFNKKHAKKLYMEQGFKNKVTMSYVKHFLKRSLSTYYIWHGLYLFYLVALLPQYVVLFLIFVSNNAFTFKPGAVFLGVKIFFLAFLRIYSFPDGLNGSSKYASKK